MNENPAVTLDRYIRARYPVIVVISHEEGRVMRTIREISAKKRQVVEWSYTDGLVGAPGVKDPSEYEDAIAALRFIAKFSEKNAEDDEASILFVMKDLHEIVKLDLKVRRFIRDIAARFVECKHNLILLSPNMDIPADLEKSVAVIDWALPDADELGGILRSAETALPSDVKIDVGDNGRRESIVNAMRGLSEVEAKKVLKSAVVSLRELSEKVIPYIVSEKAQIIRKSGVLEYYDTTVTMSEVGGLDYLKTYARVKRAAFSSKARAAGVDAPKGLLLVGPPGTGKSLSAKAIAAGEMPLLRMDVGALMGSLVGQSESNMRSALKVAEAVAPCVLWIDEIEKALGGMNGGESDGGTTVRVFGTLLTWMQECKYPVYVVATANDVRALRPELIRRFDDVMWVDFPDAASRLEILRVHLTKRNQVALIQSDMTDIVDATHGYSGAELEKVVKSAIEHAFVDNRELTLKDIADATKRIVPISVTMSEKVAEIRKWGEEKAIPASKPLEPRPVRAKASKNDMAKIEL